MSASCVNTDAPKSRRLSPLGWLANARAARQQRRALLALDENRLDDIGLTYREARREAARPIWDVPAHWRW